MPSGVPCRAALAWISLSWASATAWLASASAFTSAGVSFSVRTGGVVVSGAAAVPRPGPCGCIRASKRMAVIMALSFLDDNGSSNPYFYPDRLGDALRVLAHLLLRFGFDHHPRQGLGA